MASESLVWRWRWRGELVKELSLAQIGRGHHTPSPCEMHMHCIHSLANSPALLPCFSCCARAAASSLTWLQWLMSLCSFLQTRLSSFSGDDDADEKSSLMCCASRLMPDVFACFLTLIVCQANSLSLSLSLYPLFPSLIHWTLSKNVSE